MPGRGCFYVFGINGMPPPTLSCPGVYHPAPPAQEPLPPRVQSKEPCSFCALRHSPSQHREWRPFNQYLRGGGSSESSVRSWFRPAQPGPLLSTSDRSEPSHGLSAPPGSHGDTSGVKASLPRPATAIMTVVGTPVKSQMETSLENSMKNHLVIPAKPFRK